jgi:hypothetical protein
MIGRSRRTSAQKRGRLNRLRGLPGTRLLKVAREFCTKALIIRHMESGIDARNAAERTVIF